MKPSNKVVGAIAMAACSPIAVAQSGTDYDPANPETLAVAAFCETAPFALASA
ncbi:MAG: hypothetical protein KIS66_15650 [Fimbriimonadaceae bacterium]|nr:hypothetical protein [Fimbriimonadaceae bacterium]